MFVRLERCAGKLARTVLRGGSGGNTTLLPDDPAAPQAFNRYAYTLSNPLRYSDPTGHLSEDEIYDYFGFSKKQDARDLNWAEDLIKWLWDDDVTWGDVFTYDAGEAMLVLFEAVQQDSELYRGGFWGLNGSNRGQEVYTYEITFVDDHTETAVHLEYHYGNNWDKLPRQTGLDGYNNYDPTIYRNYWTETAGVGVISFLGGLALLVAAPPTGIAAWVGAGTTAFGATYSGYQLLASQFSDDFPVMRIPRLIGNAPVTHHLGRPTGLPGQ